MIRLRLRQRLHIHRGDTKRVALIAMPAMAELLLSHLLGMVDTIMLGNTAISAIALSAVGLTNTPINLIFGAVSAFNIGVTATVAWNIGAGNHKDAGTAARQGLLLNLIIGLLAGGVYFLFAENIVRFIGARPENVVYSTNYLQIVAVGFVAQTMNFGITGALRGAGLTRLPMIYNLGSNILNVFGNYVLIFGKLGVPALGVAGAAISTTASRFVALVAALLILFLVKSPVRLRISEGFSFCKETLRRIFRVGATASLEQIIMQIGFIFFAKTVAGLGTDIFAAHQIGLNINGLCWVPSQAFGVAATTLVGHSLGAGEKPKALRFSRMVHGASLCVSFFIGILFLLFSHRIAGLYSNDPEVVQYAGDVVRIVAVGLLGISTQIPLAAALRGAGDTKFPLMASATGIWIFRVFVAPVFVYTLGLGLNGAWWTIVLDQTTRAVVVFIRFQSKKWLDKKV